MRWVKTSSACAVILPQSTWKAFPVACNLVRQTQRYPTMKRNSDLRRFTLRTLAFTLIPAVMLVQSAAAQNAGARTGGDPNASSDKDTRPYDKHYFSGLWSRNPGQFKMAPCPECRDNGPAPGYG